MRTRHIILLPPWGLDQSRPLAGAINFVPLWAGCNVPGWTLEAEKSVTSPTCPDEWAPVSALVTGNRTATLAGRGLPGKAQWR